MPGFVTPDVGQQYTPHELDPAHGGWHHRW